MEKIISRRDRHLIHARQLGIERSYRQAHGEFLCDGVKLLEEALLSGVQIVSVFTSSQIELKLDRSIALYSVGYDLLRGISPLKNPQDVIFICKMPAKYDICRVSIGIHILLDSVQDPGNVGTILRSAYAFGIDSVILTEGCADPYNPKTIRASMGAVFKQPYCYADIGALKESNVRIIGTAGNGNMLPVEELNCKDAIIVIGNEGQGISKDILTLCESMITIPVTAGCESLNASVAASIIMYEISRNRERS